MFLTQISGHFMTYGITIPDNTGTGNTLAALLKAAGMPDYVQGQRPAVIYLDPKLAGVSGTDRPAMLVTMPRIDAAGALSAIAGTDFTTHGRLVAAGVEWYEPANLALNAYVRSNSASSISALARVLFDKLQ